MRIDSSILLYTVLIFIARFYPAICSFSDINVTARFLFYKSFIRFFTIDKDIYRMINIFYLMFRYCEHKQGLTHKQTNCRACGVLLFGDNDHVSEWQCCWLVPVVGSQTPDRREEAHRVSHGNPNWSFRGREAPADLPPDGITSEAPFLRARQACLAHFFDWRAAKSNPTHSLPGYCLPRQLWVNVKLLRG